jgi:hypothetical protein
LGGCRAKGGDHGAGSVLRAKSAQALGRPPRARKAKPRRATRQTPAFQVVLPMARFVT